MIDAIGGMRLEGTKRIWVSLTLVLFSFILESFLSTWPAKIIHCKNIVHDRNWMSGAPIYFLLVIYTNLEGRGVVLR